MKGRRGYQRGFQGQSQTISGANDSRLRVVGRLQELADSNPDIAKSPEFKKVESSLKKQDSLP